MTKNQFALSVLIVAAVIALALIARGCVLEQQRVEREARQELQETIQAQKTTRTKERWEAAQAVVDQAEKCFCPILGHRHKDQVPWQMIDALRAVLAAGGASATKDDCPVKPEEKAKE